MGMHKNIVMQGTILHGECERERDRLNREITGLQCKVRGLEEANTRVRQELASTLESINGLGETNSDLQAQVSDLAAEVDLFTEGLDQREDEYARGILRQDRVKALEEISRNYEQALASSGIDLNEDVNAQIMQRLTREKVPFEKSPEYEAVKAKLEQAQQLLSIKGNPFLQNDAARAKEFVEGVEAQKREYESTAESLRTLKAVLAGKSVFYLMTTEQDEANYKINLIMPIQNKENTRDFSRLERDLIAHIHYQWNEMRSKVRGTFKRTNRQVVLPKASADLVQYTFFIPRKEMTIQEVKQVEQQLRDSIFRSQGEYSLGALGFRIDLETFTNTRGLEVPQPQYGQEQAPREKTEIVQASPKDELVSLFNSGAREISYEEASRITGKRQCSFKISVARGGLKKTEAGNIELQSLIDRYEILMKIKTNPKRAPKPREARVQSPEDEALAKAAYMRLEELTPNGKLDLAQIAYVAGSRDRSNGTRIAQSEEMRSYRIPEGRRIYIKPEGLRAYLDRRIVIHGEWHLKK